MLVTWSEYQNFLFLLLNVCDHPPKIFLCCLESTSKHLKLLYPGYLGMNPGYVLNNFPDFFVRSSNQSSKPAKLPVTPSTATLTKSQKNKNKTKKKPVENKTTKQTSPVKNASPPTVSSSQVWHVDLWRTAHSGEFCDQPIRVEGGGVRGLASLQVIETTEKKYIVPTKGLLGSTAVVWSTLKPRFMISHQTYQ